MQVKNFILIGDIHKSIYFLSWKEQGSQLSLLAKDFGSLDCFATEFLIDGSTLSLMVSDDQKNIQVCLKVAWLYIVSVYLLRLYLYIFGLSLRHTTFIMYGNRFFTMHRRC